MGATFWVYAGGSWRQLDVRSGRVAGWAGRAGFCYQRRGRLRLAGAASVLRGLRALQGLLPGTVRDGLPLTKQRRHSKVKKQSCCCSHRPAQPSNALVQLNLSTQCATATQTSLPPPQPAKSDAAVQAACESQEIPRETSATSLADDDGPVFKELVVQEEDVSALRSLIVRGAVFPFPVDLYRFDSDDRYKSSLFYKINPLVTVARCVRIDDMLRQQQSQKSLREFTRVLGLRAVTDRSPHKSPHKSPNKSPHKLHKKSNTSDSDFINNSDSDFESETSRSVKNKYKTALRSRNEDRNKNQRSKRNTITNKSYYQSSDESSSINSNVKIDTNRQTDQNRSKNEAKSIDRQTSSQDRGITNNNDDSADSDDSRSILNPFKSRTTRDKQKRDDSNKSSKDRREDESKENRSNKRKHRDSSDEGGGRKGRNVSFSARTVGRVARDLDRDAEKRRRSLSSSPTKSIDSRSRDKQTDTRRPLRDSSQDSALNEWANRNGTTKHRQNDKHRGSAKKPLHLNQRRDHSGRFLPMAAKKFKDNSNRNQLDDSQDSQSMERRVTRLNNVDRSDVNDNNVELKRLRSDLKNVDKLQSDLTNVDKLQSDSSSVDKIQRPKKKRLHNDFKLIDSGSPGPRVTRLNNTENDSSNEKSVERRVRSDSKSVDKLRSDASSADKSQSGRKGVEVSVNGDSRSKSKASSSKDAGKRNEKISKQWSVASSQDTSGQLRREYSSLEDHCIVQWLSLGARARKVNGNVVWRELQSEFSRLSGRSRSWHSLRNRYLRSILPSLGSLALPPSKVAALRAAQATGEIKSRRLAPRPHPLSLPRVRSAWALRPRSDDSNDIESASEHVDGTEPKSKEKRALRSSRGDKSHTDTHSVSQPVTHTDKHTDKHKNTQIASSPTYSELTRRFASKKNAVSTPEVEIGRHGSVSPPAKRTRKLFNPNSKI